MTSQTKQKRESAHETENAYRPARDLVHERVGSSAGRRRDGLELDYAVCCRGRCLGAFRPAGRARAGSSTSRWSRPPCTTPLRPTRAGSSPTTTRILRRGGRLARGGRRRGGLWRAGRSVRCRHLLLATVTNPAVNYAGDPGLQGNEAAAACYRSIARRSYFRRTPSPGALTLANRVRPRRTGRVPLPDGDGAFCLEQELAVPPAAAASAVERRLCPRIQRGQDLGRSERHRADGSHANAGTDRSRAFLADEPLSHLARDRALHRRGASRRYRRPGPTVRPREPRLR